MARRLRLQFSGAIYYVMNRGDRREAIFHDALDRRRFVQMLSQVCAKTGWQIHAFCLMQDHFQLVVETPEANLTTGMKWLLGTYTQQFNKRRGVSGHVFGGRYRTRLVDGARGTYLRTVCDHVHWSPVRENLVTPLELRHSFAWSSVPLYLLPPHRRPPWLKVGTVLAQCGLSTADREAGIEYARQLQARAGGVEAVGLEQVGQGWGIGDASFQQELIDRAGLRQAGPAPASGGQAGGSAAAAAVYQAGRIIEEELRRRGHTEETLLAQRKGNPDKLEIALRLRAQTSVSLTWIADRLRMGTKTHLAHLIYWRKRREREAQLGKDSGSDATDSSRVLPAPSAPSASVAPVASVASSAAPEEVPMFDPSFD